MRSRWGWTVVLAWALACGGVGTPEDPEADLPAAPGPIDSGFDAPPAPPEAAPVPAPRPDKRKTRKRKPKDPRPPPPAEPAPAPAPPPPAEGDKRKEPKAKPPGIRQQSDTRWSVSNILYERWKDDPYTLANAVQSGDGWELRQVRQRDGFHLGMRNKDLIVEVNGHKVKTQAQLLAAWLALKNKTSFDVEFLRGGTRKTYHYDVRD